MKLPHRGQILWRIYSNWAGMDDLENERYDTLCLVWDWPPLRWKTL